MRPEGGRAALLRSFGYAYSGIAYLLRSQQNARIHAAITLVVIGLGIWLRLTGPQWAVLVLAMGLVWSAETVNTALENLVDLASPQVDPAAKSVKDLAAAAVLLAAIAAAAVGVLVMGPALIRRALGP
ncbi:MAG TPA: diacylglycerol kinase family protein [Anaerolineales bacterium]